MNYRFCIVSWLPLFWTPINVWWHPEGRQSIVHFRLPKTIVLILWSSKSTNRPRVFRHCRLISWCRVLTLYWISLRCSRDSASSCCTSISATGSSSIILLFWCLHPNGSLSVSLFFSLSRFLWLSLSVSLSESLFVSLSGSLFLCLYHCLDPSGSLLLSMSVSLCMSMFVGFPSARYIWEIEARPFLHFFFLHNNFLLWLFCLKYDSLYSL